MSTRSLVLHAAIGAIAFAGTQYLLFRGSGDFPPGFDGPGWFLNSGTNLLIVLSVLATISAVVAVAAPRENVLTGSGALAFGAVVAMIVTQFVIGLGNLFPIVIVTGAALISTATMGGGLAGSNLRSLFRPHVRTKPPPPI